jgi:folate-binding protein YgfZ
VSDPKAGYAAAREAAALFDLSDRTHIELTGRDRAKFLHNFCTNDIRRLEPGGACEAFLTNVQGKVLAFVSVYATADALWLVSVPGTASAIIGHLSRYQISEDVAFADRSGDLDALLIAGPRALEVAVRVVPAAATLETSPSVCLVNDSASQVQVRRHDFLRLPGLVFVAQRSEIESLRARLSSAGAIPTGNEVFEALRIEAGFPLFGVDITDANLAQEVNRTSQAISFTKGCYLGQEPIARIDALGHVNQQLRGLRLQSGPVPSAGCEVVLRGVERRTVGRVTSAAISYADDRPVALAYLRRGFESPGLEVEVEVNGASVPATVFWPAD